MQPTIKLIVGRLRPEDRPLLPILCYSPTFPILPSPGSTAELSDHECNVPPGNPNCSCLLLTGIDGDRPRPAPRRRPGGPVGPLGQGWGQIDIADRSSLDEALSAPLADDPEPWYKDRKPNFRLFCGSS